MKEFTIATENSFKFTSTAANDCDEIFTAFQDHNKEGYIVIDSSKRAYIMDTYAVNARLSNGTFKRLS